jgi:hypothetical protein
LAELVQLFEVDGLLSPPVSLDDLLSTPA